jgi:hypothetical protein
MPRGGANHHPTRQFRRRLASENLLRAARRTIDKRAHLWRGALPARADEQELFGCPRGRRLIPGLRKDKALTTECIIEAAFSRDGSRATGLGERSVTRAKFVAADVLLAEQATAVRDCLANLSGGFCVLKRSWDETPLKLRECRGPVMPIKMLNQRCHLRWGPAPEEASRIMLPGIEMIGTDALAMLEGLERVLPELSLDNMAQLSKRVAWSVCVYLGDSLPANKLVFEVLSKKLPGVLHWYQRCDSHQCNLITVRPFANHNIINPIYCFAKLLRDKVVREQLANSITRITETDVVSNIFVVRPDGLSTQRLKFIMENVLAPVLRWSEMSDERDVLPRLRNLKVSIRTHAALFCQMFNAMGCDAVTHYCWKPGGGRCCKDTADVVRKMAAAVQGVVVPLFLAGSADPTLSRWFSVSFKIRSVILGLMTHRLLPRAWLRRFSRDIQQAEVHAERDDLVEDETDWHTASRVRHRKVAQLLRRENLLSTMSMILVAIQPIERLHFDICAGDVARKGLGERRLEEKEARLRSKAARVDIPAQEAAVEEQLQLPASPVCQAAGLLDQFEEREAAEQRAGASHEADGCQLEQQGQMLGHGCAAIGLLDALERAAGDSEPGSSSINVNALRDTGQPAEPALADGHRDGALSPPGLVAQLADDSARSLRGRVQERFSYLLTSSESELYQHDIRGCLLQERRALVLTQSADFFMRFDLHYEAYPRCLMKLRLPGQRKGQLLERMLALPRCCLDGPFTRRAVQTHVPSDFDTSNFDHVLQSIDRDDSCVSIVENERQHGRLRVGYGRHLGCLERASAHGLLQDWAMEHKSRGLGQSASAPVKERLRGVVEQTARNIRNESAAKGGVPGGNPKIMYINAMEALEIQRSGARSQAEARIRRQSLSQIWDALPEDGADKVLFRQLFAERVRGRRLQRLGPPTQQGATQEPDDEHIVTAASCWGIGCEKYPLAPAVLDAFLENHCQGRRGLQTQAGRAKVGGNMACVLKKPAHKRAEVDVKAIKREHARTQLLGCLELFGPGVCRLRHASLMAPLFALHERMWRWAMGRGSAAEVEGYMVARFHVTAGDRATCSYYVLSRRHGNPRRLVWTRLKPAHDLPEHPVTLTLEGERLKELHCTGHCLALSLLQTAGGCERVTAHQMQCEHESLVLLHATDIQADSETVLWQSSMATRARRRGHWAASALDLLAHAQQAVSAQGGPAIAGPDVDRDPDGCATQAADAEAPPPGDAVEELERQILDADENDEQAMLSDGDGASECDSDIGSSGEGGEAPKRRKAPEGHAELVRAALEHLRALLSEEAFRSAAPRKQVNEALNRLDREGGRFWGSNQAFSRKRSAVDSILKFDYKEVAAAAAQVTSGRASSSR